MGWRLDLDPELDNHWLRGARGALGGGSAGWYFTGRHRLLNELSSWLRRRPGDDRAPRAVTGAPGSGKSAVLARLVVLADPVLGRQVPLTALDRATAPPLGSVDVAVHARGKTTERVVAEIATAAGLEVDSGIELVAALSERGRPFTIVLDGLDEAVPTHSRRIARFLADLASDRAGRGLRAIVGVRSGSRSELGEEVINLLGQRIVSLAVDGADYLSAQDLAGYSSRLLVDASPPSHPYERDRDLAAAVAAAVAEQAGSLFLVAQLTCQALTLDPDPIDTGQPGWQHRLPRDVSEALDRYLGRFGEQERAVRDLLTALAFAEPPGLPAGGLWADLASSLTSGEYRASDVAAVLSSAAGYLVEGQARPGRPDHHRLFHQELVECLRRGRDSRTAQAAIIATLRRRVPRNPDGTTDWAAADSYTRSHLAAHARKAGQLEPLLDDPGFLVAAEPAPVLAALSGHRGALPPGARAYQLAQQWLPDRPPAERASYLELAARTVRADRFADQVARLPFHRPWSTPWVRTRRSTPHVVAGRQRGPVNSVAFGTLNGAPLAVTAGDDQTLRVLDLSCAEPVGEPLIGHTDRVRAVAVGTLEDRAVAVSGGDDRTVRVWDLASGEPVGGPLTGHTDRVRAVAIGTLEGRAVAVSGGADQTARVWDLASGKPVGEPLEGHTDRVRAVAVGTLEGRSVAVTGAADRTLRVWDLASGEPAGKQLEGHTDRTNAVALGTLGGRTVAVTGGDDQTVRVWDLASGELVRGPLKGHTDRVRGVAVATIEGRPIAVTAGSDRTLRVWDLASGQPVGDPLEGHTEWVNAVVTGTLEGRVVAVSGGDDGTVRLWDLAASGGPVGEMQGDAERVNAVAAGTVEGSALAVTGGEDRTVRVWDLTSGEPVGKGQEGHTGSVNAVAVGSLEGRGITVTGGDDGTLRVWDLASGEAVGEPLRGHTDRVRAVALGNNAGRTVAISGGDDRTVRVWDLGSGRTTAVVQLDASVEGLALVSGEVAIVAHAHGHLRVDIAPPNRISGEDSPR